MDLLQGVTSTADERTPLYDSCRINRTEADLLILSYSLRHNLNDVALQDLLHLINAFLPADILPSRYLFLKKYTYASSTQVSTRRAEI